MTSRSRPAELLRRHSIDYLPKIPAEVPGGRVVVHNNVVPARRLGWRGFRAWLTKPSDRLAVCGCAWAPELGQHYRIRPADD